MIAPLDIWAVLAQDQRMESLFWIMVAMPAAVGLVALWLEVRRSKGNAER